MKKSVQSKVEQDFTVGEVAKRSGIAVSALHFYEQKGLISSYRNQGNQRRYKRDVLRRVSVIKVAQRLGIPLSQIKTALTALPGNRIAGEDDWNNLTKIWTDDLNERIRKLTSLKNQLSRCIGCGCLSLKNCPLRNPADKLSEQGVGARLLE